jgi:hypothetical protein
LELSILLALIRESSLVTSLDARDLRAYFGTDGLSGFDRSPLGGMLARAELDRGHVVPCSKCGGRRANGNLALERPGCGFRCTSRELRALQRHGIPPACDDPCKACEGRGWIIRRRRRHCRGEITAIPTGSSVHGSNGVGTHVSDADMHLLGSVSRRLSTAEQIVPGATRVLELFYGTPAVEGGRRLTSLWPLTRAGRSMLRRNKVEGLDPDRFLQNERDRNASKPNQRRSRQFRTADDEAHELRRWAAKAWNLSRRLRGGTWHGST